MGKRKGREGENEIVSYAVHVRVLGSWVWEAGGGGGRVGEVQGGWCVVM